VPPWFKKQKTVLQKIKAFMKKLFSVNQADSNIDLALLIGRIVIAFMMLTHGLPKLAMLFSGEPVLFPGVLGMSAGPSLALTVFAEVLCSLFILVGFGTRLATVPLMITMLVALVVIHAADPFEKKEAAFHFLLVYVVLFITGGGRYSLDGLVQNRTANVKTVQG
jgi:putative oxidoreductase